MVKIPLSKQFLTADEIDKIFNEVRHVAATTHSNVNQKYNEEPYGYHLDRAVDVLLSALDIKISLNSISTFSPIMDDANICPMIFAMFFHDAIEDARMTYHDVLKVARRFMGDEQSKRAAELVYALTDEKGRNRDERQSEKYWAGIRDVSGASLLKMCDRITNLEHSINNKSSMSAKYIDELEMFMSNINLDEIPQVLIDRLENIVKKYQKTI